MAVWTGDNTNNYINWSSEPLGSGQTGHGMYGLGGNDTIIGHATVNTTIEGGAGNDWIEGQGGQDALLGDDAPGVSGGADTLIGGGGQDLLFGGAGADHLVGGAGDGDLLRGGRGNDIYEVNLSSDGSDIVADDLSAASGTGFGGGTDTLFITDESIYNLCFLKFGDDLVVSSWSDANFVQIEDFFLGGNNVIETLSGNDYSLNITSLVTTTLTDNVWYDLV